MFEGIAEPLIVSAMEGYNGIWVVTVASVFCYGQTGSGKTYTMYGNITTVLVGITIESRYRCDFL